MRLHLFPNSPDQREDRKPYENGSDRASDKNARMQGLQTPDATTKDATACAQSRLAGRRQGRGVYLSFEPISFSGTVTSPGIEN